jgi:hypothetical protein
VFPLEAALNDVAAREAVVEAFRLTPVGDLLLAYIGLFKPPKRALAMSRTARLLKELLPMIKEAKIESHGRIWSAPQEYWRMAFTEMIEKRDRLTLPLKSHGYLFAVIEGYSNKAEAQAETKIEQRRAGHTQIGGTVTAAHSIVKQEASKPRTMMPDHVKQALKPTPKEN